MYADVKIHLKTESLLKDQPFSDSNTVGSRPIMASDASAVSLMAPVADEMKKRFV